MSGSLLISFDPVFIRLSGVSGFDTAFLFGLFSFISMSVVTQHNDSRGLVNVIRQDGWPLILSALLMVGSASSFVLSVKHTAVANTMIILSARPVLTALTSWLFLREQTDATLWSAIAGVLTGVAIVVSGSLQSPNLIGDGFALIAVMFLALNGTLMRKHQRFSRTGMVGLAGLLMTVMMIFPARPSDFSLNTWLVMAAMGLFSAPIGRVLNGISSRYIPATEAALFSLTSSIIAPVWIFLVFVEKPSLHSLIGGGVVLLTISFYIFITSRRRQHRLVNS